MGKVSATETKSFRTELHALAIPTHKKFPLTRGKSAIEWDREPRKIRRRDEKGRHEFRYRKRRRRQTVKFVANGSKVAAKWEKMWFQKK